MVPTSGAYKWCLQVMPTSGAYKWCLQVVPTSGDLQVVPTAYLSGELLLFAVSQIEGVVGRGKEDEHRHSGATAVVKHLHVERVAP